MLILFVKACEATVSWFIGFFQCFFTIHLHYTQYEKVFGPLLHTKPVCVLAVTKQHSSIKLYRQLQ